MKSQFNSNTKVLFNIIAISVIGLFTSGLKAQPFDVNMLQSKASWAFDGIGGPDRVVFESHSLRTIARYDSFPYALLNFFEDAEKSQLNFDSMMVPLQMHYILFENGKRKLTIENPEYSAKEFDLEKEIESNTDSLPANLIEIYDVKHQINIKIYVANPSDLKKLKSMAFIYRDSIGILSKTEKKLLFNKLAADPKLYWKNIHFHYFNFCEELKEFIKPNERQLSSDFIYPAYHYENNTNKLSEREGYSFEDPIEPFVWSHIGIGFLDRNMCLQQNIEISLYTHFKNDLPRVKVYTNLGILGFTEQQNSNSNQLKLNSCYETLLGFKLNNLTPKMKSEKEFRVTGLELGMFFKGESSTSTLLPTSGFVGKFYRQWGNFRFTTGIYQSKTSVAGLITVELFDLFGRYVRRD